MTVRKKIQDSPETGDTMDLSRHLTEVKRAIKQLPTDDEGAEMNENTNTAEADKSTDTAASSGPKKKVAAKKPAKKTVAKKKVSTKVPPKKKGTPAAPNPNAGVKLVDIVKGIKDMEQRKARRVLRGSKIKNPGRWAWVKGHADIAKATALLKEAAKGE